MEIKNKVIIVTGGVNGIGREIALELEKRGGNVIILDIDRSKLALYEENENILPLYCDITNINDIEKSIEVIEEKYKEIHILINNAGVIHNEPLINIFKNPSRHSVDTWNKIIKINLTAPFVLTSYVAEHMVKNRIKGVIINISSISAKGNIGQSAYSASKAGLNALTRVWAKELGIFGIRCVSIAPGFIDSEAMRSNVKNKTLENIKNMTPLKELGKINDIVEGVKFAIKNDFYNGSVLKIDGGLEI